MERTVKDVLPALKTNQEGLKKVLEDMVKQYKGKQDELDKWKVSNHTVVYMKETRQLIKTTDKEQCSGSTAVSNLKTANKPVTYQSVLL